MRFPSIAAVSLTVCSVVATAQSPMLVSTDWLAGHLNDRSVVVLQVVHDSMDYAAGHIPGARAVDYAWFTTVRDSIGTELPSASDLKQTFERLGISDDSHVVVYVSGMGMAPMASRLFLTLDYLGHPKVSLLNGGLAKWRAEGRSVSNEAAKFAPGHLTPKPRPVTVDADWVMSHAGKRGVAFIDTRTDPEYLGTGERSGLRSDGHVTGAKQLQWQQLFANADSALFLPTADLKRLYDERVTPGDTVVTYCLVGYRASMTYFGARLLGLPVKIYDGSYQDWARRKLPVTKGPTP